MLAEIGKLSGAGGLVLGRVTFGHGELGVFGPEMCSKQVRIWFWNSGEGSGISIET